ncbi:MAG: PLP-dependent aspartate aminotransferase family protein [Acidobacteriota bacterium]|nr:PLP-dependent aspartate aminotransferase family protein [Acidobacteriota bacterium]
MHAGQHPDSGSGAVVVPLVQAATFVQKSPGQPGDYEYSRTGNPTRDAVEANLASLEGGAGAVACASGMAAIVMAFDLVPSGGRVVATSDSYGGTYRIGENVLRPRGLDFTWVDTSDTEATIRELDSGAAMLFLETPTNPMLRIADLETLSEAAHAAGALVVVDNTFMSPYFQRPLELGADIVVHSSTKYLNGHSDGVGGILVARNSEHHERFRYLQNAAGAILSPFESWLLLRSTKTLALRMERHDQNAREIARMLVEHRAVAAVHYPGLPDHPGHELARRQMSGFGGMLSFDVGTMERARRVMEGLSVFHIAESLGGVESLANHPATMTHASIPEPMRRALGIGDGLVRLSVGIEDIADLRRDLEDALETLG